MAAANDATGLSNALHDDGEGSALAAAVLSFRSESDWQRSYDHLNGHTASSGCRCSDDASDGEPVPPGVPLAPEALQSLQRHRRSIPTLPEDTIDPDFKGTSAHCLNMAILAVCGLNAIGTGAIQALEVLLRHVPAMWSTRFDEKGCCVFHYAVEHACRKACLEGPVHGIQTLLRGAQGDLNRRVRGSNGSSLHIAAARGHLPLVHILLAAGMDRTLALSNRRFMPTGNHPEYYCRRGYKAVDWARNRGHIAVVDLLSQRAGSRPVRLTLPCRDGREQHRSEVRCGTLARFDFSRGNGFIEPDLDPDLVHEDPEDDYAWEPPEVEVHIDVLRAGARPGPGPIGQGGFPQPGQRIAYLQAYTYSRLRNTSTVADGDDGSWLELPLREACARVQWANFRESKYDGSSDDY